MAINVPGGRPTLSVPSLNNRFLEDRLREQQQEVPKPSEEMPDEVQTANYEARRANATGELPENTQSTSSPLYVLPEDKQQPQRFASAGVQPSQYEPSVFSDIEGSTPEKLMDIRGNEITDPTAIEQMYAQERERQAKLLKPLETDWQTLTELSEQFPDSLKPTQAGSIQLASRFIGEELSNINVRIASPTSPTSVNLSAMTRLKQGLGTSTRSTANVVNMSGILLSPMLAGAAAIGNGEIVSTPEFGDVDYSMAGINDLLNDDGQGVVSGVAVNGGVPREMLSKAHGRLIKKLAKGASVDPNNQPIDPSSMPNQDISSDEAGEIAVQAQVAAGYYTEDITPEGVETIALSPGFGHRRYINSRDMGKEVNAAMAGKKQRVPGPKGNYVGVSRNLRQMDKKKNKYKQTNEMDETKYITGSISKHIGAGKALIGSLLVTRLAEQLGNPNLPLDGIDTLPLFKIGHLDAQKSAEKFGNTYFLPDTQVKLKDLTPEAKSIRAKFIDLLKERKDHLEEIKTGQAYYTPAWEDYATHRVYLDPVINSQRNKFTRAVESFTSAPVQMDTSVKYHVNGITRETANSFWDRIGNLSRSKNASLSPKEFELSFLATLGRVLNVGKTVGMKTEQMIFPEMLSAVTPEFIQQAAIIGEGLKSIAPTTKGDMVASFDTLTLANLTDVQKAAVRKVIENGDRETWGYVLQGYVDAADYLSAKKTNSVFNPKVTVAIDANSAGLMFLASDIGNYDILQRVGLVWEYLSDNEFQDTQPEGDPRRYFTQVAKAQSIDTTFGPDNVDGAMLWKEKLDKFGGVGVQGANAFNKEFAKKTLLTTGYGKASAFHMLEAQTFLAEYPDFKAEMLDSGQYNGDEKALLHDLNNIFKNTVRAAIAEWQFIVPKKTVQALQMFDRVPHPVGTFNEELSFGRFGSIETGTTIDIQIKNGGRKHRIKDSIVKFDPLSPAKRKGTVNEMGEEVIPGPGTAAINQVGPAFGQYRESVMLSDAIRHFNEGKNPSDMLSFTPVFDNLILNSKSYPLMMYTINNISLPKVLKWDMVDSFVKDFQKQANEAYVELDKLGGQVSVGNKGDYKGFLFTLDREYGYLKDSEELTPRQKQFKEFLESEKSGWKPPESRPEQYFVSTAQFKNTFGQFIIYKNLPNDLKKWNGTTAKSDYKGARERALKDVERKARAGQVYGVT